MKWIKDYYNYKDINESTNIDKDYIKDILLPISDSVLDMYINDSGWRPNDSVPKPIVSIILQLHSDEDAPMKRKDPFSL